MYPDNLLDNLVHTPIKNANEFVLKWRFYLIIGRERSGRTDGSKYNE